MGSEFIERNKRKSLWAALLLIFRGRGKYAVVLFVAGLVSVPFLLPAEKLGALMSFPPVAAVMRAIGFGGSDFLASSDPGSQDIMAAEMARAEHVSKSSSFWDRFLKRANAPLPPAGSPSSMDMMHGGREIFGPPVIKDKDSKQPKADEVKGAVSPEEQAKNPDAGAVDLQGAPGGAPGGAAGGDGGSMYGDMPDMAGGGGFYGSAPYANRTLLSSPGGTADKASGMYNRAVNQTGDRVPPPGSPRRLAGKMGRVSGFAWRNMGRNRSRSAAVGRLNNKKPMFQLSEAFSMAGMAFESGTPEYETSYGGAVYDGNEVDADFLQTDAITPTVPSSAFANSLIGNVDALNQAAIDCANAATEEGAQAATDATDMAEIQDTMDFEDPPSCCNGSAVNRWNKKVDGDSGSGDRKLQLGLVGLCNESNALTRVVTDKCQTEFNAMPCHKYADMHITCHWYSCLVEILCWIVVFAVGGIVLTTLALTGVFGDDAGDWVKGVVRWMSGYDMPEAEG
ncbi:MAG: hypothetical protein COT18_10935 [Elusimicrobia bacterium CG08_land_8_20_14_0_20_59_10]|nr:MAG: hypothetical protein COT18_10935 [Elusimicrobia bacterium CG08_land_8_20_14_0_20_59_10]